MASKRLTLELEVQEILKYIDSQRNFLLSGGAGSGKTYSLVQLINQIIIENPTTKIACITYTNAAVKEIEERVKNKNLRVSTIHDFLWDNIKQFQKELKTSIVSLANDKNSKISIDENISISDHYFNELENGIQYKEYLKIKEGIISHDELLLVANHLFSQYPKLCNIVKDKYPFILIDEFQDTNVTVIEIFLDHFKKCKKKNIIGFFGDSMQSIYDDGIGNLNQYTNPSLNLIIEIKKKQNRRNPLKIINIANKLRIDSLIQEPSTDNNAPNMKDGNVKKGEIIFLHSNTEGVSAARRYLTKARNWNFDDSENTKELNLTHRLIANEAGFKNLMNIYDKDLILSYKNRVKKYIKNKGITTDFSEKTFGEVIMALSKGKSDEELKHINPTTSMNEFIKSHEQLYVTALNYSYEEFSNVSVNKEQLLDDKKRNALTKHLFKIQNNIMLYCSGRFNEFLRVTDYRHKIINVSDKRTLKNKIETLTNVKNKTIGEIIDTANKSGICLIDDKLNNFKANNKYLYDRVKNVPYSEFQQLYDYLEGKTPFSTQHKTKGAEFNNIFVVLDNGNWHSYNFEKMFSGDAKPTVDERTKKIFYVCCTRAKEKLAVFFHKPNKTTLDKAKEWFGEENVIPIS